MRPVDAVSGALLLGGTAFVLLAAVGLQRFDDVFARMHAATKATTLGLLLVLGGTAIRVDDTGDVVKLLLAGVLQFVTAPVSAHMVGRAAYRSGTELSPDTVVDQLADAERRRGGGAGGSTEPPPPPLREGG